MKVNASAEEKTPDIIRNTKTILFESSEGKLFIQEIRGQRICFYLQGATDSYSFSRGWLSELRAIHNPSSEYITWPTASSYGRRREEKPNCMSAYKEKKLKRERRRNAFTVEMIDGSGCLLILTLVVRDSSPLIIRYTNGTVPAWHHW